MPTRAIVAVKESKKTKLSKEDLLRAYQSMLFARRIDEKILILLKQGKSFFHIGGSGHEGAQVAAAAALRPKHDWSFPYYRDLAYSLHMGVSAEDVFLIALHRAEDPATGGRQPQGHYGRLDLRIPTQSSPTGTQYLQAVGVAMGAKKERTDEVVYVSSGEGATSEGEFFEAANWAARDACPVIFFIEDNKFAISVPVEHQTAGASIFHATAGFKGLDRHEVDGSNFLEVYNAVSHAVERARKGGGPSLIHAHVVRLLPHSSSDDQFKYRSKEEIERDKARDPIPLMTHFLIEEGFLTDAEASEIQAEVKRKVEAAADWAESRPLPDPASVEHHVYGTAHITPPKDFIEPVHTGPRVVMVDSINHALKEEMERNPKMIIFGEDIADGKGGGFHGHEGNLDKVRDGPRVQFTARRGKHPRRCGRSRVERMEAGPGNPIR